jgi:hypothetical protein
MAINQGTMALCSIDELQKFTKTSEIPPGYGPVYPIDPDR